MLSLVFLIIITAHTVICQRPTIVDQILPDVKRAGSTGRLNCTVLNLDDSVTVTWSKPSSKPSEAMVISENERIALVNPQIDGQRKYEIVKKRNKYTRRTTFMLVIGHLTEEDSGNYTCYLRLSSVEHTQWPKEQGLLTVQVPPTIRKGTSTLVQVNLGDSVNLTCLATGIPYPNITWSRSDGLLLPTGGGRSRGPVLFMPDITERAHGNYQCSADNNVAPTALHTAQVLVFCKPSARAVQDSVGQAQNKKYSATLVCVISGHPEPSMKWMKRTNQGIMAVNDDEKHVISKNTDVFGIFDGETLYTMKIINVQANDYTKYICTAVNKFGVSSAEIKVFETSECQGSNCPSLDVAMASHIVPMSWRALMMLVAMARLLLLFT